MQQRYYSRVLATGSYLPANRISNNELAKTIDTSDEWITSRTGIKYRHIAADDETNLDMMKVAVERALATADVDAKTIDLIVVGSCTPDKTFPSLACYLQSALGITNRCPAFDIAAACSGFVYALSVVDQYIRNGIAKRALVVGSEKISRVINWQDRSTCVLFGDGAGVTIIERSDEPGIYSTHMHADGSYGDALYANHPFVDDDPYLHMEGNTVFKYAVNNMGAMVEDALTFNNMTHDQIDWLIPHQANLRIIKAMAKKLSMPMERVIVTVDEHANTSSASVPLAFDDAIRSGKIKRGDVVLLEAFGGGLTWGSALLKY